MMTGYAFAIALCVLLIGLLLLLMRMRRIREKYAAIWLIVAFSVVILAIFPNLAMWLAKLVGVQTPVNLLFAVAFAVLLGVCIQLSAELSALEEETRTVVEELALLRLEVRGTQRPDAKPEPHDPADAGPVD